MSIRVVTLTLSDTSVFSEISFRVFCLKFILVCFLEIREGKVKQSEETVGVDGILQTH